MGPKRITKEPKKTTKAPAVKKKGGADADFTVILDTGILNESYGADLPSKLRENELKYQLRNQLIPHSISFERRVSDQELTEELLLLLILKGSDVISWMETNSLIATIKSHADIYPDKKISLLIFGFRKYLRSNTNLSRLKIETELTRLQLHTGVSHRLIEKPADLVDTIVHFGKSVQENLIKRQKIRLLENENFYFANDNKDCVKVLDNVVGLGRLWQQHLLKLPFITLESAEAIMAVYPMPKNLLDAFKSSSNPETLLRDLPIRRGGGPLATIRRFGPEMSRKFYQFYHSLDPNELLKIT